jgi:hypothetical protein
MKTKTKLTDTLDLMVDEFKRIRSCPGANAEIKGLCDRAIKNTYQHVPVIVQRDRAEEQVMKQRVALQEIADEAVKHHEHNPVSGKDRLPIGYKNILNIADRALCRSNKRI